VQVLEVKALIGYFDLDPNRAVALALQAFASQPGNAAYLPLFRLFVPDSVGQTLGFLFQHAQAAGATPDSLFAVAVALMQARPSSPEILKAVWYAAFQRFYWPRTLLQTLTCTGLTRRHCISST
jgi:hypothetical protein